MTWRGSGSGRSTPRWGSCRTNSTRATFTANLVVVSCGAINSAALLLRSANDKHPHGLANNSGVVGRHYMGHTNSVLMAISKCPNSTVFQKTLAVNDFYFGAPDWDYPMGHISFVGKLDAVTLKGGAPAIAPKWTLEFMATHSLDFWLTSEDLPDPENRVRLDREGNIVLTYKPNNAEAHQRLIARLKSLLQQQTTCAVHGHACHEGLFAPAAFSSASASRWRAWRIRTAPSASVVIPRPRHSMCTAKRTISTISTWLMPVSSRPAVRSILP